MNALATPSVAEVWNEILAPKFTRFREVLVKGAEPHGRRAMALFRPRAGDRVLDVGCGFGETTFQLADEVGFRGSVIGLDVADAFLAHARREARERHVRNVSFVAADAETYAPGEPFDYAFGRFGTMFFERPVAAFKNLRVTLRPGAPLVMTVWRSLSENPWLRVAKEVAREHLPPLADTAISCGPGPFSLADTEVVREILQKAGFREVSLVPSEAATLVGRSLEEAVDFQLAIGPAGQLVREAASEGQRALPDLRKALAHALEPFMTEEGVLMPSAAWLVRAT